MLLSEFIERTGYNCQPDVYAEIESVYNEMTIDKDCFCAGFKKIDKSEFTKDLFKTAAKLAKKVTDLENKLQTEKAAFEIAKKHHEEELKDCAKIWDKANKDLAKKIVRQADNESINNIYNVIEEEFGYDFIIKAKHEMGLKLTDAEINYLVGKL